MLGDKAVTALSTEKITPPLPALKVRSSSGRMSFALEPRVGTIAAYIFNGGFTGDQYRYANWNGYSTTILDMSWNSDPSKNIVLALVNTRGQKHVLFGQGS